MFLYTDTCFSFQTKFTGFKFTRVSFWHISNHHNDWSDLVRSVCGVKLVLVEFRSSSDLVFLFTSSRNCFKTASLASSDRFSSTEGGDRTQGASAERHLRLIFCCDLTDISRNQMLPLFPSKRKTWRQSSENLLEGLAQSPTVPFFFSILISPIMPSPALTSANKFLPKQSKARAPTTFSGLTSKTSWKSESLRCRSRLHLVKLRFYIGRHLVTKCKGSSLTLAKFTFYVRLFKKCRESRFTFYLSFFCIISPVGVVGQPVVGRHQQVDRVDLGRLGSGDHDDFRLWWW